VDIKRYVKKNIKINDRLKNSTRLKHTPSREKRVAFVAGIKSKKGDFKFLREQKKLIKSNARDAKLVLKKARKLGKEDKVY